MGDNRIRMLFPCTGTEDISWILGVSGLRIVVSLLEIEFHSVIARVEERASGVVPLHFELLLWKESVQRFQVDHRAELTCP